MTKVVKMVTIIISIILMMSFSSFAEEQIDAIEIIDGPICNGLLSDKVEFISAVPMYTICDVNLRANPLEQGNTPLEVLLGRTEVGVLESSGGWSKVEAGATRGYISSKYLITKEEFDSIPFQDNIFLTFEEQYVLYTECKKRGIKYALALATIELESGLHDENGTLVGFNRKAYHKNSSGSVDRGICQINSSNVKKLKKAEYITCADDLYDSIKCIKCGMYMLSEGIELFGNCEQAYAYYNTGKKTVKSNKNSRKVVSYWEQWKTLLGDI